VPLTAALLATPGLEPLAVGAPLATKIASKVARRGVKKLTGYGKNKKICSCKRKCVCKKRMGENEDVGIYTGGKNKQQHKKNNVIDKRKLRGQAMRELMGRGKSFSEASKEATEYMNKNLL
jgi:hypothetical protein